MMKSLERKTMKKAQMQELIKRIDDLDQKIKEQRKWLQEHNTINFFVEDIRQEIRDIRRLISS